jgi:hypothetical protein
MYPNKSKLYEVTRTLRKIFRKNTNLDSYNLILILNPIIRRWANYFNLGNSSVFRDYVRQGLYRQSWKWAYRKHPKWGKKRIAAFYFIHNENSYFKNRKWVFKGESRKLLRHKKNSKGKIVYLVDPINIVRTLSALTYVIPEKLLGIHAFHADRSKIIEINNKANLLSQKLAEKSLFYLQKKFMN